jgi:integral membrane sensor domain MASE1
MRLKNLQIVAALGAAIAFVLAFMAAGALLASLLFAVIGAGLVAWVAYGLARQVLERRSSDVRHRTAPPRAG